MIQYWMYYPEVGSDFLLLIFNKTKQIILKRTFSKVRTVHKKKVQCSCHWLHKTAKQNLTHYMTVPHIPAEYS